jgi:hypothetical protein
MSTPLPVPETQPLMSAPSLVLTDRFPVAWRMPRVWAGFAAVLGFVYWCLSRFIPLWHTDLWGHLAYGRYLWETGSLPATEPLMPMSCGMSFIDTAWLSQVVGYLAYTRWGVAALLFLYAVSITTCCGLLLWRMYERTSHVVFSLAGMSLLLWLSWEQFRIIRPQLAGVMCFVALLTIVTSRHWRRGYWFAVPALFAAWANVHGSWPAGIALLGCWCTGHAFDVWRRTGRIEAIAGNDRVRRLFLLTELAAVAVLANPYGFGIYTEVFAVASNSNLDSLVEWRPLNFRLSQGQAAAAVVVALAIVYRITPRRISSAEVLSLIVFGAATLWTSRMINWWAPVAAYCLVLHGYAAWRRWRHLADPEPSQRTSLATVLTAGLTFLFFSTSPFGFRVVKGIATSEKVVVSSQTPIATAEYLRKNPPQGVVFTTVDLGDYLVWAGPPNLQVLITSHAHLIPNEIWREYNAIRNLSYNWDDHLNRLGINTVVADKDYHSGLISRLKDDERWQIKREDEQAAVFVRKEPL